MDEGAKLERFPVTVRRCDVVGLSGGGGKSPIIMMTTRRCCRGCGWLRLMFSDEGWASWKVVSGGGEERLERVLVFSSTSTTRSSRRNDALCIVVVVVVGLKVTVLVPGLIWLLEIIVINAADVTGFLRGHVGLVPYGVPGLSERAGLRGLRVYCLRRGADSMTWGSSGCTGAPPFALVHRTESCARCARV